jgi:putative redox protein
MSISQKMIIDWKGNYLLVAKNNKGLTVSFDAPLLFGGEESALSPMENVLGSLAACSSIHIISILKEKEQKMCDFSVEIQAE